MSTRRLEALTIPIIVERSTYTADRFRAHANVLILVLLRLLAFLTQPIVVLYEINQLTHFMSHIHSLILPVLIDECVVLERTEIVDVLAGRCDDTFAAVLYEIS